MIESVNAISTEVAMEGSFRPQYHARVTVFQPGQMAPGGGNNQVMNSCSYSLFVFAFHHVHYCACPKTLKMR